MASLAAPTTRERSAHEPLSTMTNGATRPDARITRKIVDPQLVASGLLVTSGFYLPLTKLAGSAASYARS